MLLLGARGADDDDASDVLLPGTRGAEDATDALLTDCGRGCSMSIDDGLQHAIHVYRRTHT